MLYIVGDLHLSDKFQGAHKDYKATCRLVMSELLELISNDPDSSLILLGDLFGVSEKRFQTRAWFLEVWEWFQDLNTHTKGRVYSVVGNHDISHGDLPDFEVFRTLGAFTTPNHLDFTTSSGRICRFHFLHYGNELRDLDQVSGRNIGLGHNDFGGGSPFIDVDTTQFKNLSQLDLMISGHIHNPSSSSQLLGNSLVDVIYPGCPTRVTSDQRYPFCYIITFDFEGEDINWGSLTWELQPLEDEFTEQTYDSGLDSSVSEDQVEALREIVGSLNRYSSVEKNLVDIIKTRPDLRPRVRDLAVKFLTDRLN